MLGSVTYPLVVVLPSRHDDKAFRFKVYMWEFPKMGGYLIWGSLPQGSYYF